MKVLEVILEVWGDFACFSQPSAKVERLTYPVPPPSAARGILSAIYMKPKEFYWQIKRIEVLNPIRYISFKRNEVKSKVSNKPVYADEDRTQRQTVALRDVHYRITAAICTRQGFGGTEKQISEQAMRRIRSGKVFFQPSLGLREFEAYFKEGGCENGKKPIPVDMDLGFMVYDVFDLNDCEVRKKTRPRLSLYHCVMRGGVIDVPPYDSPEVIKGEAVC